MKKNILKWIIILLAAFAALCLIMLFSLSLWNSSMSKKWLSSVSTDGELINVGDHAIFCRIKGQGKPIIIFEGDAGSSSAEWLGIQEALPVDCTSLVYDRAGYGWSAEGKYPRNPEQIVEELTSLLKAKGLDAGPFILVGQGLGAYYLQYFAAENPTKIMAMILSQPYSAAYSQFRSGMDPVVYKNLFDRIPSFKMAGILGKMGLVRFFNATPYRFTPQEIKEYLVENYSNPQTISAMLDEYRNGPLRNAKELKLPRVPITVIHHNAENFRKEYVNFYLSYNDIETIESLWKEMLSVITKQSSSGRIISASESFNNIHIEEPKLILAEILAALKK